MSIVEGAAEEGAAEEAISKLVSVPTLVAAAAAAACNACAVKVNVGTVKRGVVDVVGIVGGSTAVADDAAVADAAATSLFSPFG